jgi:predicted peptidase
MLPAAAFAQRLAPGDPNSPERKALITAFENKAAGAAGRWERRKHLEVDGWTMPYRLFRPASKEKLPLVLYLHGAGGLGDDNEKQISGGNLFGANLWALPETQKRHPCYVAAPQSDRGWIRYATRRVPGMAVPPIVPGPGEGAIAAADLVKTLVKELPIDERRVYVTGQSMGGAGTWNMIAHLGHLIAAAVPLCASPTPDTGAENPHIPVWQFHGSDDGTVQASRDRTAIRRNAGGKPLYTEYPGVGHNVGLWAYTEPSLPGWLFSQQRGV